MPQIITVVVDKHHVANHLAIYLTNKWKDAKIYTVSTAYIGLYEFDYPHGISFKEIPYLSEPRWKKKHLSDYKPVLEIFPDRIETLDTTPQEILEKSDKIILATSLRSSEVIAFDTLISQSLGEEKAKENFDIIVTHSLSPHMLEKSVNNLFHTHDKWYLELLNQAKIKKYFDYNFNVNSLLILGNSLRATGVNTSNSFISKYSLQILFELNSRKSVLLYEYFDILSNSWEGTGRYPKGQIASPLSRSKILEDLQLKELIHIDDKKLVSIASKGKIFLSMLHPDCCDLDLPFRLREWELNWNTARPKIDRYLNTFFGKQKKYQPKQISSNEQFIEK